MAAPLDIEWVWYVHMMNPDAYEADCKAQTGGKVIDHQLLSPEERKKALEYTKELWNKSYPGEIFNIDLDDPNPIVDNSFKSSLRYNLKHAVSQEMIFNYQISLPHFKDEAFRAEAIKRYLFMLSIYKESSKVPVVPYFDNDLIWHAHMAHPKIYRKETTDLFFYVLPHQSSDSIRLPGSEAWAKVAAARKVWEDKKRAIAVPGGMFRGTPPVPRPARNPDRYTAYSHKAYYLQPKELRIQDVEGGTYRVVVKCEANAQELKQTCIVYDSGFEKADGTLSKKFDHESDEARFRLDTDVHYGMSVSLYKQVNETLYESYVATCQFPPSHLVGKRVTEFSLPLTLKFAAFIDKKGNQPQKPMPKQFNVTLDLLCRAIKPGNYFLCIEKKENPFRPFDNIVELLQFPSIVMPFHMDRKDIACHYADYYVLGSLGEPAFHLRIIHCLKPKVSLIEVADFNSEMVSSAHIVDNGTLPTPNQVLDPKMCVSLNPQTQRALVIRSENNDWGILRGTWQGKLFDAGHLAAELFTLGLSPQKWVPIQCSGPRKTIFTIDLTDNDEIRCKVVVDLERANVTFHGTVSYVPELLSLSASIAVLYTLCQVREAPPKDKAGRPIPYSALPKKSYRPNLDEFVYVINAGLYCPSLPRTYEN